MVTCFNADDGLGQCLQGKLRETGLLPGGAPAPVEATATAVDPVEAVEPAAASEPETDTALVEPELDVVPADAAAEAPDNLIAATFGLLRAEPDGSVVIAGSGTPGSEIEIYSNGTLLGTTTVEASGDWVLVPDVRIAPGGTEITLGETGKEGLAPQSFVVAINEDKTSEPLVVASTPGAVSEVLQGLPRATAGSKTQIAAVSAEATTPDPATPAPAAEPTATEPAAAAEASIAATTAMASEQTAEAAAATTASAATSAATAVTTAQPATPASEASTPAAPAETAVATATATTDAAEPAADAASSSEPAAAAATSTPSTAVAETTAQTTPTEPAAPTTEPATAGAAADPVAAPAVEAAVVEAAAPAIASDMAAVTIDAVEVEGERTFFAGSGPNGATVRLYVDDSFIADSTVSDGRWLIEAGKVLTKPNQRVRIDMLQSGSAEVASRAEVDFVIDMPAIAEPVVTAEAGQTTVPAATPATDNPAPADTAAQPAAEADPAIPTMVAVSVGSVDDQRFAAGKAIIRRGDNLWTIARRVYGEGIKYTTIYEANTGQIRDPDRIYPGQVFNLPEGAIN
ncbi:LysM peptidoglycan-binding domain-containing protein [Devosia sp. J2-20]|uniref:LysM peptidoglycan-binding domain-containing protein n=1 Tax=Devosia sp. J2-20 TaxID=3026161 RepID=UPI00249CDF5F|nr:LysM peptidoglycan-binding domain-containing protein [Devosia sp. J2-20]WDQ97876.1 LysM peptidoglycan-binding domain-containing protein [Devosia sp. J2-20]